MKCRNCDNEAVGKMPIELKLISFFDYEIRIWKWVDHDLCNNCAADICDSPLCRAYDAGYDAGVDAVLQGSEI